MCLFKLTLRFIIFIATLGVILESCQEMQLVVRVLYED